MKSSFAHLERFRREALGPWSSQTGDHFGAFSIPLGSALMVCIVSDGSPDMPWEHVSLRMDTHKGQRQPTWEEMCVAKDFFWDKEERVVQFHPPESEYVNNHAAVLHLWKWTGGEFPFPPSIAVGIKNAGLIRA